MTENVKNTPEDSIDLTLSDEESNVQNEISGRSFICFWRGSQLTPAFVPFMKLKFANDV